MQRFELLEQRRLLSANAWTVQQTTGAVDAALPEQLKLDATRFDVDNDGVLDQIKLNSPSGGNQDSTFTVSRTLSDGGTEDVSYFLGNWERSIAIGDVNNDGFLDVVTTGPMRVFKNDGNGVFDSVVPLSLPERHVSPGGFATPWGHIAIADLDEDGIADFALGTSDEIGENHVELWRGFGDGHFEFMDKFAVDGMVTNIRFGDINGDKKLDGLVSHRGTELHNSSCDYCVGGTAVAFGISSFDFEDAINVYGNSSPIYEDLGGGNLGIHFAYGLVTLEFLSDNGVFENDIAEFDAFASVNAAPPRPSAWPAGVWIDADFDNDGLPDWANIHDAENKSYLTVFWGQGNGEFDQSETRTLDAKFWSWSFQVRDINNDGLLDLASSQNNWSLEYQGNRSWGSEEPWMNQETFANLPYNHIAILGSTDLNQDNREDAVLSVSKGNDAFIVFAIQTADGFVETFRRQSRFFYGSYDGFVFGAGDFDSDGNTDVVVDDAIMFGDGEGGVSQTVEFVTSDVETLQADDFNGDGALDISFVRFVDISREFAFGNADRDLTSSSIERLSLGMGVSRNRSIPKLLSGDMNNDGLTDIVAHGGFSGFQIYFATADGTYAVPDISYVTDGRRIQQIADFDGDGDNDLLIEGERTRTIWWNKTVSNSIAGDFDSDRSLTSQDLDLLWAAVGTPTPDADRYDLNDDQQVDQNDVTHWIEQIAQTKVGDIDLDRDVDFADFLILSSQFGKTATVWSSGNLNGDEIIDFADFLLLSSSFGFDGESD